MYIHYNVCKRFHLFFAQYAKARTVLNFAKVMGYNPLTAITFTVDAYILAYVNCIIIYPPHTQDAYSGYEFEARLNFKVHSALNSIR